MRRVALFASGNFDALHRVAAVEAADPPCIREYPTEETLHVDQGHVRKLMFGSNAIQQRLSVSRAEAEQPNARNVRRDVPLVKIPISLDCARAFV